MKLFTIDEIRNIHKVQKYRYFGLYDQAGVSITPFNPNSVSGDSRLRQIEMRLVSDGLPDGYYVVKCKQNAGKFTKPDEFIVAKGKPNVETLAEQGREIHIRTVEQPTSIGKALNESDNVLSYESALELQVTVERQKLEIEALQRKILDLEQDIIDLESDATLSESTGGVWERAQTFLEQLMTTAAPMIDKHYELKERKLTIEAMRIQSQMNAQTRRPQERPPRPQDLPREEEIQVDVQAWVLTYQDRPEIYEQLAHIYNTAAGDEDFIHNLKPLGDEIVTDFINFLEDGGIDESDEDFDDTDNE